MATPIQPAYKSYYFGKGYRDLWATIQESWARNIASMEKWFSQGELFFKKEAVHWLQGLFCYAAGVSVVVFGSLLFAVASLVHVIVLGATLLTIYLTFTVFYGIERVVSLYYRIFVTCPHCHLKFDIPVYACPVCSAHHTQLRPGVYGIFLRSCECDRKKLVTSLLTGRSRYDAFCPHCGRFIENPEVTPFCVPVIGTPNSGKTCFIYTGTEAVEHDIAPPSGWTAIPDGRTKPNLEYIRLEAAAGRHPDKTVEHTAKSFSLQVDTGARFPQMLHLYDSAGEVFTGGDSLDSHHFYGYSHGFVVIIDANAILHGKSSSRNDPEDAFVRMINKFKVHGLDTQPSVNRPIAVVLNKIDTPDVRAELGDAVDHPEDITCEDCVDFLNRHGFQNLLAVINLKFSNNHFFAASTLRREGRSLKPRGVEQIMRWLLDEMRFGK